MDPHRLAEERSIAFHRAIAAKLTADPTIVDRARQRVRQWRETGEVAAPYVDGWTRLLALGIDALCQALVDPGEPARAMRQVSPFAGALEPRERWRIWRAVGAQRNGS